MNSLKNTRVAAIITNPKDAETYSRAKDILLEFRIDHYPPFIDNNKFPENAILTYRSEEEGGKGENDSKKRKRILRKLLDIPLAMVDFEIRRDIDLLEEFIRKGGEPERVILSAHDYSGKMERTVKTYKKQIEEIHSRFPDLCEHAIHKFVGKPEDSLDLFLGIEQLKELKKRVVLGIGKIGEPSRTLSVGNQFIFGTIDKIPGIMDLETLTRIHGCEKPFFTGLIGKTLAHSLSPTIHSLLFDEIGQCGYYHLFPIKEEERVYPFIEYAKTYEVKGLNVTFPYKEIAARIADIKAPEVVECGAANTLKIDDSTVSAFNTDISGFTAMLKNNRLDKVDSVLVVGAGGAAKAVCVALMQLGIEVFVYNRSKERLLTFPKRVKDYITYVEETRKLDADVYINTTPVGMNGKGSPTEFAPFPENIEVAIDIGYSLTKTGLIKTAEIKGIKTLDGKEMLFHQAVDTFEIWTGASINRGKLLKKWLMEVSR
ncbi:MAG: type I 3-dehydroquinate dehydratase [Methanobacteriota archaeon]|nr:MAG: type I 3-dehydroquinate dehydratase [Euryarchaeota archaeon]